MVRSLGVLTPQLFTISDLGNKLLGLEYAVLQKLWNFLLSCAPPKNSGARMLVLLHYAGHGMIDKNGQLVFFADSAYPRTFRFSFTLNPLFNPFEAKSDNLYLETSKRSSLEAQTGPRFHEFSRGNRRNAKNR